MAQYLQALSPEQLDAANVNQYLRNQKIIALTPEDYPDFVEELKKSLCNWWKANKKMAVTISSADSPYYFVCILNQSFAAWVSSGLSEILQ